jgi:hypothetical protein
MQTEISDLQNPARIEQTVGQFEIAVRNDFSVVQEGHPLRI